MIDRINSVVKKSLQTIALMGSSPPKDAATGKVLSPDDWLERLRLEQREVEGFSKQISKDFMQHSRTLEALINDIESLKDACNSVVSIIASEDGETPIQFSYQLFKKSEDIILASFDQFRMIFDSVRTLRELIKSIESNQNELSKITVPLKMITVQYRITASMMDEKTRQEFYDLADKLNLLINEIRTRIEKQFQDLTDTGSVCSEIISDLESMVSEYEGQISQQLGASRSNLNSLSTSLDTSHALINEITNCSDRLSEGVFSIMVSMQTQDMTSQKLEHICTAIDSICGRLESTDRKNKDATLYFVREASKIQSNQLGKLFHELESATESIRTSALETESETDSIAKSTQELSSVGNQTNLLKTSAESVRNILAFVESTLEKTRGVLVALKPLREKFTDSTEKVMNIAAEMRMVAVNAQVYAANVTDGEALEVLSHSTQKQSLDAKKSIENISINLDKVASSLMTTEESLAHFAELGQLDMDQLLRESAIAQSELHRLEKDLPALLEKIQASRTVVTERTQRFAQALQLDDSVKRKAAQILELFREISTARIKVPKESKLRAEQENISSLQSNYTMQSEVNLHNEVVEVDNAISDIAPQTSLNDNFDRFDDLDCNAAPDTEEKPKEEVLKSTPKTEKLDDNIDLF